MPRLRLLALALASLASPLAAQQLVLSRSDGGLYTVNPATAATSLIPGTTGVALRTLGSQAPGEVVGYDSPAASGRRVLLATAASTVLPTAGAGILQLLGMDCNPASGDCWVAVWAWVGEPWFGRIDPASGAFTLLASAGGWLDGLAFAPSIGAAGSVFGVGGGVADLHRYDIATNTWHLVGPIGFPAVGTGLAFDPAGAVLYLVPGWATAPGLPGHLYTVSTTTGAATLVGSTGLGVANFGLTWVPPPPPWATGVDLSASPPAPLRYAQEIAASSAQPVTLVNTAGGLNLSSALGYSFSQGEVRHARIECPASLRFAAGSTVVASDDPASTIGALNGLGSNAISFSITADTTGLTATDTITITGDRVLTAATDASCSFALYDQPSQAQVGGAAGRIVSFSGAYLAFVPSWQWLADPVFTATANVEANPAFTAFVPAGDTTTTRAGLAELSYGLVTPAPRRIDGNPITLAELMASGPSGTTAVVTGDFSAAANSDGSFTGAALNRVFIATNDTCTTLATAASALTATTATFNVGATAFTDRNLCLQANGTTAIPVADYTAQLVAVAASAAYAPSSPAPLAAGRIERNGTELQAPLVQMPSGWIARIALTNSGGVARPFTWRFVPATGGSAGEASTSTSGATSGSGSIPANGLQVLGLNDLLGGFGTTPPRGSFLVTVAAPSNQIQGLYQIVNPGTGTISNHVMVRPGSN